MVALHCFSTRPALNLQSFHLFCVAQFLCNFAYLSIPFSLLSFLKNDFLTATETIS